MPESCGKFDYSQLSAQVEHFEVDGGVFLQEEVPGGSLSFSIAWGGIELESMRLDADIWDGGGWIDADFLFS